MKKIAAGIVGVALAIGVVLVWSRPVRNQTAKPEAGKTETRGRIRIPVEPKEGVAPKETPAPKPAAPFRVRFSPSGTGKLVEPITVELVVEADLKSLPAGLVGEEVTLEYLLRLPSGVQLKSDGWTPAELPPGEKDDPTGVWSLFERKRTITTPAEASTAEWAREKITLAVVEKGTNWIITTRARLTWGSLSFQTFGVVFATVSEDEKVEFHTAPRSVQTEQRAQANRS